MRISVYMVDAISGQPADGTRVRLLRLRDDGWATLSATEINSVGRIPEWEGGSLDPGLYRIVLDSGEYFSSLGAATICSELSVVFRAGHQHSELRVHVILSPYSCVTYFGAFGLEGAVTIDDR